MAWETSRMKRTLTILRGKYHGETIYYIAPLHDVVAADGQVYKEHNNIYTLTTPELYRFTTLDVRDADSYGSLPTRTQKSLETMQGPSFSSVYPGKAEPE
tara:strand:+ start:455 stop:754 length:300 start_codon:yes stop_codon:yes gene_type:complete